MKGKNMTRLDICRLWTEGKITDEQAREMVKKTTAPKKILTDPLYGTSFYYEGEEKNSNEVVWSLIYNELPNDKKYLADRFVDEIANI